MIARIEVGGAKVRARETRTKLNAKVREDRLMIKLVKIKGALSIPKSLDFVFDFVDFSASPAPYASNLP